MNKYQQQTYYKLFLFVNNNSLSLVQNRLYIFALFQVRLQNRRRGSSGETLANSQAARVLEGVEDLAAKKTTSSGNKNV